MVFYDEKGKAALVTGAERGIGRGIAIRLAEAGYDVFFTYYYDKENALEVQEKILSHGRKCCIYKANFKNQEETCAVVKKAASVLGRLDLVVNNAAVLEPIDYIFSLTPEQIDTLTAINYRGYMIIMRDAIRYWIKTGTTGNIVNIASESSICPHQKFSLYGGIKAAIMRSSENVALDAAPYGIRINCIMPGEIERDGLSEEDAAHREEFGKKLPISRQGTPRDVANAVLWLASNEATYVTGANLTVDGGLVLTGMGDMNIGKDEVSCGFVIKKNISKEEMETW